MLAFAGRPSLHGSDACMVHWTKGASRRICRQKYGETSFSPLWVFLLSRNSSVRFWGLFLWHLWVGRARHPRPPSLPRDVGYEVFNVGGWLTHGDLALEVGVDVLAVTEHRLIPARVRSEWSRLEGKGLASIWAPACQDSSHVADAGVGVLSMKGAPLALPTFATAQFKKFFDYGRVVRCMLPLGFGRFMHLVRDLHHRSRRFAALRNIQQQQNNSKQSSFNVRTSKPLGTDGRSCVGSTRPPGNWCNFGQRICCNSDF